MKKYNDYPKQINTLIEMIDEYKGLKAEREKLGDIYEYGENDTDFDHDKWFELQERISYFPDMDIKQNKIISSKEVIESFDEWKKLEYRNTYFNDRKGMPILTVDNDIIYYVSPNPNPEMNSTFLGSDLEGNEKMYQISDIKPVEFNKYWPSEEKTYSVDELKIIQKELKKDFNIRKDIEGLHGFPMVMKNGSIVYYGLPYNDKQFDGNSIHNTEPEIYNYKDVDLEKSKQIWLTKNKVTDEVENLLSYKELSEIEKSLRQTKKIRKNTI